MPRPFGKTKNSMSLSKQLCTHERAECKTKLKKAQLTLRQAYIPRYWRWARETFNKFHVQCQSLNAKKSWWKVEKNKQRKTCSFLAKTKSGESCLLSKMKNLCIIWTEIPTFRLIAFYRNFYTIWYTYNNCIIFLNRSENDLLHYKLIEKTAINLFKFLAQTQNTISITTFIEI